MCIASGSLSIVDMARLANTYTNKQYFVLCVYGFDLNISPTTWLFLRIRTRVSIPNFPTFIKPSWVRVLNVKPTLEHPGVPVTIGTMLACDMQPWHYFLWLS
jgi:hypothetical protein